MDQFVELLKEINVAQIFVILAGFWMFYNRLEKKINKVEERLEKKINDVEEKLSRKIDRVEEKLSEKIEDIDRRLCRIEGSLSTHGHCLFNQAKPEQKAQ